MRIRTKDIRKIVAEYAIYTDDIEVEPVIAGLTVEFSKELIASEKIIRELVDNVGQAFKDLFEKEVE